MGNLLNHLCGQPCTLIIASAQSKVKRALLMLGRSGADEAGYGTGFYVELDPRNEDRYQGDSLS